MVGGRRREGGRGRSGRTHVDARAGGCDDGHEEGELGGGVSGGFMRALFGRRGGDVKG